MKLIPKSTVLLLLLWSFQCSGQDSRVINRSLAQLRDFNDEIRIAGLRNLQTSLDPRIAKACLPLLSDKGNSIRRLAARAIGSRDYQIEKDRIPEFVQALRGNLVNRDKFPDEGRMVERAIGLLSRDYKGEMFAISPDGKWVIYERHRLPCLIDVKRQNEELLGWNPEGFSSFLPAWGNGAVAGSTLWREDSGAVALGIAEGRKTSLVWIWMADGSGLFRLDHKLITGALSIDPNSIFSSGGSYVSIKRWNGRDLVIEVSLVTRKRSNPDEFEEFRALMAWNMDSKKLRELKGSKLRE